MATRATAHAAAIAIALTSAFTATSAATQIRVAIGGQIQYIPTNTARTVTTVNGRTRVVDAAWTGDVAMPGMARITTTETMDEDGEGHVLSRTIVTRIEPERTMIAVVIDAPPRPAPRIEIDPTDLDEPVALGTPHVLRINRDSGADTSSRR